MAPVTSVRTFSTVPSERSYVTHGSLFASKSMFTASTSRCEMGETTLTMADGTPATSKRIRRARRGRLRRGLAAADRARDLELPFVERERVESGLVLRAPHLHAPDPPLDVEVARRMEPEVEDPVREVRLLVVPPSDGALHGRFRDDQGRRPEVPQPLEQVVQLRPPVLELRHRLQHVEGVEDEEADLLGLHEVRGVHLEQLDPGPAGLKEVQVLADRAHVQDGEVLVRLLVRHPELVHVLQEDAPALLEGEVRGLAPLLE